MWRDQRYHERHDTHGMVLDHHPGRFLLTGSANLMALPTVADSLAGRMETLMLLPLSQSEIESRPANWIDRVFAGEILTADPPVLGDELLAECYGAPLSTLRGA